ncbi:MAG: HlyD family secretion protein [Bacteroidales bacterium]|nr:HlyD family secretion protein [Bacteroidales bacterium]
MPLNQIEIRTEEIDEILGKTPNSIIRWGITVIFAVIVLILIGSWFFKYPDFIKSTVEITTTNPPTEILAHSNGKIVNLLVRDEEKVTKGQYLAIIENSGNYRDIIKLKQQLEKIQNYADSARFKLDLRNIFQENFTLGELQVYLSSFLSAFTDYKNFINLEYYPKKIFALKKQLQNQRLLYESSKLQKQTLAADLVLAEKEFKRYDDLFQNQTIPESEFDKIKSRFLQKKYTLEGAQATLDNINIQIAQLENLILDQQLQYKQKEEQLIIAADEALNNLVGQIEIWEQRYVLKAPVEGICTFTKYWSINQNVTIGEQVMSVIPNDNSQIIGKLLLPVRGSGKVKTNQKVNIRLLNYPYMEYGMVSGIVGKISLVPADNFYYVEVHLPEGLKTNYGIDLLFTQKMQGEAEIITEDIRLFERVLKPIKSLIKNRSFKEIGQ